MIENLGQIIIIQNVFCFVLLYLFTFNFSEQSNLQGQKRNPADVLDRIRNGIEVGNTKLAVAALAAHIASTANLSLAGENPPVRANMDLHSNNRIRHRHPPHAVTI